MTMNKVKYRLGLDMGTNSIGWAAVELDANGEPCGIVDMGVRIFPDGRDAQSKTSNAVDRRVARGQRRRRDRYLKRRGQLTAALIDFGLMPEDETERKKLARKLDPYKFRARALDEPLKPFELGRALFHLDQRRGFKSNRKAVGDDENEAKRTRGDIGELRRRIDASGARTLGEYLARRHRKGKAVRARPGKGLYPDRSMYAEEFDAIRESQEPHQALSEEQWDKLREVIFFQLPLQPVDPGWCRFEDGEKRAARALPVFQEFRMLQEVNNLRVLVGAEPERALDEHERERALQRLKSGKDIVLSKGKDNTPAKPTKDLGLPSGAVFNLSSGGRKAVNGDETAAKLAKPDLFGKKWFDLSLDERNEIVRYMLKTEDPDAVRHRAIDQWGLSDAQADAVSNVALVSGYGNLSEKAILNMLRHLEKGLVFSGAAQAAGYHHSDFRNDNALDKLPYYGKALPRDAVGGNPKKDPEVYGEPAHYGRIGNPTVHIGLNQLRRVINGLIDVYGKPEEIVVELARDLKTNREQLSERQNRQNKGRADNKRFRKMLESEEEPVTADILRKLRLWEEQGRVCPYTGRTLSCGMVISNRTEVDHILPFSRTLDNSMANMVVCVADANRAKGDQSPHEAFGHSPSGYSYDDILVRAAELPANKRWRFQPDAMKRFTGERGFLDRQLNETRYLSRTTRTYLAHLYDEKAEGRQRVRAIPGRMTALLRYGWGLNGMLSHPGEDATERKRRDDHRHHAIDAFVVANTTQGLLQRFARASASYNGDLVKRLASLVPPPWKGFSRSDLKQRLDDIVVSYKPDHGTRGVDGKTTGQLHNATAYRLVEPVGSGLTVTAVPVTRKTLSSIKSSRELEGVLKSVRDDALRTALMEFWDLIEAEGGKPADFAERAESEGVPFNGRHQRVRHVRVNGHRPEKLIPIRDKHGKAYKGYKPDNNEFADVWQMRDGSWKIVAVPTFYANQRNFDIEDFCLRPTTSRGKHRGKPDPAAKRLMRIYKNDMGALGQEEDLRIVRVRQVTDGRVILDDHREADVDGRERRKQMVRNSGHSASALKNQGFRKVGVDEIGRFIDPGPFPK